MRRVRAFTLVEVLVAAGLAAAFSAVVGLAMVASMSDAAATTSRVAAEGQARTAMEALARYLRGARPPGLCLDPVGEASLTACRMVGEGVQDSGRVVARAFSAAGQSSMSFWSSTGGALSSGTALQPPSLVTIDTQPVAGTSARRLLLVSARTASGSYLSPVYGPLDTVSAGEVDVSSPGASVLFRYFDGSGTEIAQVDGAVPAADLARIAFVRATPVILWTGGGESGTVSPALFVAVPSRLYSSGGT